ncbi:MULTISPECIES: HalOD1 output domain-containing protein [Haloarcula]|uniref:HalOD1 output domain-containing protein n=1 Tax=Haloarcula TaxID=2237 RepID=UPI0023ED712C|nr:HalOD1 output domain-containing protein [Halomicroarcula sp. XH51]
MNRTLGVVERRTLDGTELSPAVSIVSAVADAADANADDLEPLETVVPVDALNRVAATDGVRLDFEYEGYVVDVEGGDAVAVRAPAPETELTAADD